MTLNIYHLLALVAIPPLAMGIALWIGIIIGNTTHAIEVEADRVITPLAELFNQRTERAQEVLNLVDRMAQCPHCGHCVLAGSMCDDLSFICPQCAEETYWQVAPGSEGTDDTRYILVTEKPEEGKG